MNLAKTILRKKHSLEKEKLATFKKEVKNIRRKLLYYFEIANACEIERRVLKFEIIEELKDFDYDLVISPYQFTIEIKAGEKIVCIGFNKKAVWVDYEDSAAEDFKKLHKFNFNGFTQQETKYVCDAVNVVNICIDNVVKVIARYVEGEAEKYLENLR